MNAREITKALAGDWQGQFGLVPGPGHSPKDRSCKVWDAGNGDILIHSFAGDDWRSIRDTWQAQGFFPADDNPNLPSAKEIWRNAESADSTRVETYLASRAITCPIPPTLRYAGLKHGPTGLMLPAMVAVVQNAADQITGIHRTYLMPRGDGKARVSTPKMMLGRCSGSAVRLALTGDTVAIAEGIEDGLSVLQKTGTPTWAALSTSGLVALQLPPRVRNVTICQDADTAGENAANLAAKRWQGEGRTVRIAKPPRPYEDFNAALMATIGWRMAS